MRNATILVVRLKGVATEAIKNIVLAGIGRLVVVDPDDVAPEDLGAGFFFRDADVGSKVSGDPARPWVLAPRTHARTPRAQTRGSTPFGGGAPWLVRRALAVVENGRSPSRGSTSGASFEGAGSGADAATSRRCMRRGTRPTLSECC